MKVIAINGSPRKDGNTEGALNIALNQLKEEGFEVELINLQNKTIKGCIACGVCKTKKGNKCYAHLDDFLEVYQKVMNSDGIILGSPVYFGSCTPEIKAFIDRCGYVSRANGGKLKRKVGGSIAVARRGGHNFTFAQMNYFFLLAEMIIVGSSYWNIVFGSKKGEYEDDAEGIKTIINFAENMSWVLRKIKFSPDNPSLKEIVEEKRV